MSPGAFVELQKLVKAQERAASALERIADRMDGKPLAPDPWWNASHTGAPHAGPNDFDVLTGDSGC